MSAFQGKNVWELAAMENEYKKVIFTFVYFHGKGFNVFFILEFWSPGIIYLTK